jgi:hypothetical protein
MMLLIAQNDDPELLEWLANADTKGGDFIGSLAHWSPTGKTTVLRILRAHRHQHGSLKLHNFPNGAEESHGR